MLEHEARPALTRNAEFADDEWFTKLSLRMLSVNSPLDVSTLRGGMCRARGSRGDACVPPVSVMANIYRSARGFEIDAGFRVRALRPLDYHVELPATEWLFVDILRSSWTGVLDHATFRDACVSAGMLAMTFAATSSQSAILDQAPGDIWFLRGTRVSAITAAALQYATEAAAR